MARFTVPSTFKRHIMTRFFTLLLLAVFFAACGGPEGTEVEASDAVDADATKTEMMASTVYNVDAAASNVNWAGSKPGGTHTGTIPVNSGQLVVADGNIVAGKFTMDVRGLTNTDMPAAEGGDKLVGHLKSADFFDVEKFPMAQFEVTNVQAATDMEGITHKITGNLTLKGVSKSITIPANVSMDGGMIKAAAPAFVIDRMDWGIEYGNGSIAGLAQDKIIADEVGLELMIVAKK